MLGTIAIHLARVTVYCAGTGGGGGQERGGGGQERGGGGQERGEEEEL